MARPSDRRNRFPYNLKKLVGKYFAQRIPCELQPAMTGCYAITFRPGGYTSSFGERSILPAGAATLFRLGYDLVPRPNGERLRIPITAYHGQPRADGGVSYDLVDPCLHMDVCRRPRPGVGGEVIDPERNPSLLETALLMDRACQRWVAEQRRFQRAPLFPRVLLGFPVDRAPTFEDSPALRQLAAKRLGMPAEQLGSNGALLLDRLLRDTWEQALILPGGSRNWTGTVLVDAALCPSSRGFLRAYEDFQEMLNVPTWNPARSVPIQQFPNPAKAVLDEGGLGSNPDFNQALSEELVARLLKGMNDRLSDAAARFSVEDLLDGITSPARTLVAWSKELPRLRAKLAVFANECCTDEDLKAAVRQPDQPLWLRHACRIQVLGASAATEVSTRATPREPASQLDEIPITGLVMEELQLAS